MGRCRQLETKKSGKTTVMAVLVAVVVTAAVSVGGTLLWQHLHPPAAPDWVIQEEDVLELLEEKAPTRKYGSFVHRKNEGSGIATVCYSLPMPYEGELCWLFVYGDGEDDTPQLVLLWNGEGFPNGEGALVKEYYNAEETAP